MRSQVHPDGAETEFGCRQNGERGCLGPLLPRQVGADASLQLPPAERLVR